MNGPSAPPAEPERRAPPARRVGLLASIPEAFGALTHVPGHAALLVLAASFCALRFVALDTSPPGFFGDEVRAALHQVCLGQQGISGYGQRWPMFVVGAGDGLYTPPFLYLGMLWVKLFGPSIASCRALAATFTLLTSIGVAVLARRAAGPAVARYAFLAAALSPWAFQFARIAWDPPLAPAFLIWAIVFWLGRARWPRLVLSSVCFALALYCYPPMRIQGPLLLGPWFAWGWARGRVRSRDLALFSLLGLLIIAPLLIGTANGSLMRRGGSEAIFASDFVASNRAGHSAPVFVLQAFLDNFAAHFRPSYLFFVGDENMRHSTRSFGVFGVVDVFALALAVYFLLRGLLRRIGLARPESTPAPRVEDGRARLLAFATWGYACGVVPAALCWSGVPHALRSSGSWPFLALAVGVVLAAAEAHAPRRTPWLATAAALLHAALFLPAYFIEYPKAAGYWYDQHTQEVLRAPKRDREAYAELVRSFPEAVRYYEIADHGATCASSLRALEIKPERDRRREKRERRREQRAREAALSDTIRAP